MGMRGARLEEPRPVKKVKDSFYEIIVPRKGSWSWGWKE